MTRGARCALRRRARQSLVLLGVAVAGAVVLAPRPAFSQAQTRAKWIDLYGSALLGGTMGGGSAPGSGDFFKQSAGLATGVNLGLRLTVVDLSVRFLQTIDSHGASSTLSSVMLGTALEIPLVGGGTDISGRPRAVLVVLRPALGVALAIGTPSPVHLPIDNAQLSAKGFLVMGRCGVERLFNRYFGVGAELQGGYHTLIGDKVVLDGGPIGSQGWQLAIFTQATAHFGF